ncbi:MAG: protein kinase [Myxococcales bacterium]|nr:protein kinase [Myxococcales bacterium]
MSVGSLLPPAERAFGDYELVSKIATGGMAEIVLARREVEGDRELVAIKRVLPHLLDESRFIAMFRDEGRLAAQIIHPNVCRVFESGAVQGTYYIAMEYLHGVPLSRMLIRAARTKKPVDVSIAVGVVMQCATGLHHAHELTSRDGRLLDVVHRDVSPPNILVTTEGVAKMLDFGVAKARGATQKTRTGTIKGKNSYMSPEQILGKEVDRRSDVFSLGIVLWEALTAKRLFSRDTDFLTFTAITKTYIPDIQHIRPDVSDELAAVVKISLSQDRDRRYATAIEFHDALAKALGNGEAQQEEIGEHIRLAFSKELATREALTANISERLAIVGPEEDTHVNAEHPTRPRASTQPARQAAIDLALETNTPPPRAISHTDQMVHYVPASPARLVLPVIGVCALVVIAFALLRGDTATSGAAGDREMASAAIVYDAGSIPIVAKPTPDAGDVKAAPDAAPAAIEVPKVDNRSAYLTVDSSPYATIYVDGKKLGVTPIFKVKLKPGAHKLRVVSATGAKKTMNLRFKPGRTKNLGRLRW